MYTYPEFIAKYFPNDVKEKKDQSKVESKDNPSKTWFDILTREIPPEKHHNKIKENRDGSKER